MGLFKKIANTYRTIKQGKEVCCQNLFEIKKQINTSIEECCDNLQIKLEEQTKNMYEEFKSKGTYIDSNAFNDYWDGTITKKEYDERNENYKKFVEQKIKETDEGKITHQEFFDAIFSR